MPRLVMHGIQRDDGERRDITRGDVDGVSYVGSGSERIWYAAYPMSEAVPSEYGMTF